MNRKETVNVIRLVDPNVESNCYILFDCRESCAGALVDSQTSSKDCIVIDPNNFELLEQTFQVWNLKPEYVLLTHGHCDHISGLNELREHYEVTVVSTTVCSKEIQNTRDNMSRMMELFLYYKSGERKVESYDSFCCEAADIHFQDQIQIPFTNDYIRMKALPGHTHGSCVICYRDMIFCGDYLIQEEPVMTRLPGGSEEEYGHYAKPWLQSIPDGKIICPGHGNVYLMGEEARLRHDL